MVKKSKGRILKISLIIIFCSVLIGLAIWRLGNLTFTKPPELQNFIFLSVDDLRADRLGCYGNERDVSPNIDMLANQGTQFLNAFISWPMTFRSHGSMFTSVYPPVFDVPLDPNIQTIASIFNNYGYKTAAFTGGGWMSAEFGILNGFEEYNDKIMGLRRLENKTKKWLEENQEKKFFLFLHTYYIHRPFVAPEKYFEKFADPKYSGPIKNNNKSTAAFIKAANAGEIAVTPEDMQRMLDIYDSQIPRIDEFVSLIVETLKRLDLINKTMLIITSDHGEQLYEYKHFGHHSQVNPFADITTRVPLVIYCPILRHKGKVEKLVEVIDIPLTMLEAAGIEIPKTFQGQSFFPVLNGIPQKEKKEVFFCTLRFIGIRTEELKLIVNLDSGEVKLYDLINDPTERENIVNKRSASEVESLIKEIEIFEKRNADLRRKLGISQIKLAKGLPSKPITFDSNSVFLATFNDNTFFFRKENSRHKANFSGREFLLMNGKYGNGLFLGPDRNIEFPLKAPILSDSGAVEFWFKIDREGSDKQKLFRIDLDGEDSSIFIQAMILWNWGEKLKKRVSFEFARSQQESIQKEINFSTKFAWNTWHHISIAWEPEEVFLLIDGVLASREKTYSGNFFRQKLTDNIKLSGENCMLDEFRISNVPRLYRPSQQRKKKLDSKVLKRLKSLGYIK